MACMSKKSGKASKTCGTGKAKAAKKKWLRHGK